MAPSFAFPRLRLRLATLIAAYTYAFERGRLQILALVASCRYIRCTFPEPCTALGDPVSYNQTSLKVVLPSVGQTGTTSVMQALRQMGYRSYHIEERKVFANLAGANLNSAQQFADPVSRCRTDALSLEPGVDVLPYVIETSPDAKFILTWRAYPSWRTSTVTGGAAKDRRWGYIRSLLWSSIGVLPWASLYDSVTGGFSEMVMKGEPFAGTGQASIKAFGAMAVGAYDSPIHDTYNRGVFKMQAREEAYLAHMNEIRQLVPPDRLLEFDVRRHGWDELASFLSKPAPRPGTPFPHMRTKNSRTNDVMFYRNFATGMAALGVCAVLHALNFVLLVSALRLVAFVGAWLASCLATFMWEVANCWHGTPEE